MISLLFVTLAFAFASQPTQECKDSSDCVLVRDTYCNEIIAIRLGHDKDWAKWEAKLRKKHEKEKTICKAREQEDIRLLEAVCENKICTVTRKIGEKKN
jgi:hypothetical protein